MSDNLEAATCEELAVALYQLIRKNSYRYSDDLINRSPDIRKTIIDNAKAEAALLYPSVSKQNWSEAIEFLQKSCSG